MQHQKLQEWTGATMRRRISPSMVVALVALFFSLTGASFAAGRFLVTSKRQIAPWVRAELKGQHGPRGFAGAPGAMGSVDWSRATFAWSDVTPTQGGVPVHVDAACPTGTHILDGGYQGDNENVTTSRPNGTDSWVVIAVSAGTGSVQAWAICAP